MSLPRRSRVSAAARVRRFWIAILVLLIAVSVGGVLAVSWRGFRTTAVQVRGNIVVSRAQILDRAAISSHQNVWLIDTREIASRIETIPDVLTARVYRSLPNRVTLDVTERVPFARVVTPVAAAFVDDRLRVLTAGSIVHALPVLKLKDALPLTAGIVLKDPRVVALRDDARILNQANLLPKQLWFDRYGELAITLPNGIRVLLGDRSNFRKKIALITPILSQLSHNGRVIRALDLRAPNAPVVVYR